MEILVLGGSVFLSREVALAALARGHRVTCANRGRTGSVPDGARFVRWDRSAPPPDVLQEIPYDAVVDVARLPGHVRHAVGLAPAAHYVFVSTINVYADDTSPGGPGVGVLREPNGADVDLTVEPEAYGPMKVACEELVRAGAASSAVVRPGLIVGPGDPSGRFSYWAQRLDDVGSGEVLAPGAPGDGMQVIDVRDLAAWIVRLAEERHEGVFDAVGERVAMADLLAAGAPSARFVWVDQAFLEDAGVMPWSGAGSIPLWLPRPQYDGMRDRDPARHWPPACGCARSPTPSSTPRPGCAVIRTPWSPGSIGDASENCWRRGPRPVGEAAYLRRWYLRSPLGSRVVV
ncbi:NAD-dependent epimerase/dehydratase family protein [Nocardioides sambongensis]|uniref:NAD-dependent epimerase/dehydratase family protein n=1 Tax=Nocardioides sambongensis TaxID=2589074 RepID=UPI001E53D443|nr:NAD-dependent epimerase/dehydratase family protein [Nocardioides sambongensis]